MNIVCIASEFKGNPFLRAARECGAHVTLLTKNKHLSDSWWWDCIDEVQPTSDTPTAEEYINIVTGLSRNRKFDRVCPLDEFDVLPAAHVRHHLQIRGQGIESAALFRDKLTMRNMAARKEIPEPDYVSLIHTPDIVDFIERVAPPWIIKPRNEVAAFGIRKIHNAEQLWENLRELDMRNVWRDHPSQYLLEKFIVGQVFHVDSIVHDFQPLFANVGCYGTPPFEVTHGGGVSTTKLIHYDSPERAELEVLNRKLLSAFGLQRGITHAEFLHSEETGEFYLLEIASRVGGAFIADVLEAASGLNLWAEWAKLELATEEKPYQLPEYRKDYAGIAISLARQEWPDTSAYNDAEIVMRINKPHHVGLLVNSPDFDRVEFLLNSYCERFSQDFLAIAPAKEHFDD
jgi:biotin carboxylase